jgi:hypothetical protein
MEGSKRGLISDTIPSFGLRKTTKDLSQLPLSLEYGLNPGPPLVNSFNEGVWPPVGIREYVKIKA